MTKGNRVDLVRETLIKYLHQNRNIAIVIKACFIVSRNLVPDNIIKACIQQTLTQSDTVTLNVSTNMTEMIKTVKHIDGMNVIGKYRYSAGT